MRRPIFLLAFLLIGFLRLAPEARCDPLPVDLELVLAVDVSRSIDDEEYALQKQGYAQAFVNSSVLNAIKESSHGRIAVTLVEWSGADFQKIVVPWMQISDEASGQQFSEALLKAPRSFWGWTSISGAIDASVPLFGHGGFAGTRKVIDVSGDGVNNSGRPAASARDDALREGITINGLVIMNDKPNAGFIQPPQQPLDQFYRDNVIGGPGSFVIAIEDFDTFAFAIVNKLVREIAGVPAGRHLAAAEPSGR